MDYGLWTMDYGLWTMDYGLWKLDPQHYFPQPLLSNICPLPWNACVARTHRTQSIPRVNSSVVAIIPNKADRIVPHRLKLDFLPPHERRDEKDLSVRELTHVLVPPLAPGARTGATQAIKRKNRLVAVRPTDRQCLSFFFDDNFRWLGHRDDGRTSNIERQKRVQCSRALFWAPGRSAPWRIPGTRNPEFIRRSPESFRGKDGPGTRNLLFNAHISIQRGQPQPLLHNRLSSNVRPVLGIGAYLVSVTVHESRHLPVVRR